MTNPCGWTAHSRGDPATFPFRSAVCLNLRGMGTTLSRQSYLAIRAVGLSGPAAASPTGLPEPVSEALSQLFPVATTSLFQECYSRSKTLMSFHWLEMSCNHHVPLRAVICQLFHRSLAGYEASLEFTPYPSFQTPEDLSGSGQLGTPHSHLTVMASTLFSWTRTIPVS